MLAAQLLDHLSAAGVRLELQGGRLRAGPSAALTPGLRGLIADHKGALVALLASPAASLEPDAPAWHGFTLADLEAAAGEDWPEVRDRPAALAALAGLLRTQAQRDRGEVPTHYTQAGECATCGPVWLWEGAPARLIACPWCLARDKGAPTPRPLVVREGTP